MWGTSQIPKLLLVPLLLGLLFQGTCGGEEILIVVRVIPVPEISALETSATLGTRRGPSQRLSRSIERFTVALPRESRGHLQIHVDGLRQKDKCAVARGIGSVDLDGADRYEVEVTLTALAQPACRVRIEFIGTGEGVVLSKPGKIGCRTEDPKESCEAEFAPDEQISLEARARVRSIFAGWTGGCGGVGVCVLKMANQPGDGALSVKAHFLPTPERSGSLHMDWPPRRSGNYYAVWASAKDDVWTVGDQGTILHFDGKGWTVFPSGTSENLHNIFGFSKNQVWIVGQHGILLHWDGRAMRRLNVPTEQALHAVWGTDPENLWVVGERGVVYKWNGSRAIEEPRPSQLSAELLSDIWGTSADNFWIVGWSGTLLHFSEGTWSRVDLGTNRHLRRIWGSSAKDLWLVGQDAVLRGDGVKFTEVPAERGHWFFSIFGTSGQPNEIWVGSGAGGIYRWDGTRLVDVGLPIWQEIYGIAGSGKDDIWAAGSSGTLVHFDGKSWKRATQYYNPAVTSLWASSANDAWAAGASGYFHHWDGKSWNRVPSNTRHYSHTIAGVSAAEIWATSSGGELLRWDGQSWKKTGVAGINGPSFNSIWVNASRDLWLAGSSQEILHVEFDERGAERITRYPTPTGKEPKALWGSGPKDIIAIGTLGLIFHFDGQKWQESITGNTAELKAIWGRSSMDVWAAGLGGALYRYNGSRWDRQKLPLLRVYSLNSITGGAGDELWIASDDGDVLRYTGGQWVTEETGTHRWLFGVWPRGPEDRWIYGAHGVLSLRGEGYETHLSFRQSWLTALSGTSMDDVWAVGGGGQIRHYEGSTWIDVPSGTQTPLNAVLATSPTEIWVAGASGTLLRGDGTRFQPITSPTTAEIRGLFGSAPKSIWAVGQGVILHYDGQSWTPLPSDATWDLNGIWGSSEKDLWAVGNKGLLVHYDGQRWSTIPSPVTADLSGIWGSSTSRIWAVGRKSTILHFDGQSWSIESANAPETWLHGVWGASGNDVWAVGDKGTVLLRNERFWNQLNTSTETPFLAVWGSSPTDVRIAGDLETILRYLPDG